MYIVSKFRDYYDTASAYGIDKTCIYLRAEKVIDKTPKNWHESRDERWPTEERFNVVKSGDHYTYSVDKVIVGFCGELYPMVYVQKVRPTGTDEFSFFNNDDLQKFLAQEGITKDTKRYWYYGERDFHVQSEKGMSKFFDQGTWTKLKGLFAEHHCPVFSYGKQVGKNSMKTYLVLNPSLKKLGFMKVKDPQSAFQDVYMYLSGVLGMPLKPTKPIDDKVMAASKGHDGEYSFKRPPGKKSRWR